MKKLRLRKIKRFAHGHIAVSSRVRIQFRKINKQMKTIGATHMYKRSK